MNKQKRQTRLNNSKKIDRNIFPPEPLRFGIIYEDEYIIAVDKPPFLVVHPTPGQPSGTLGNALAYYQQSLGEEYRIRFINRLDRDTSGIMLIAKTAAAQTEISSQMKAGTTIKKYMALVHGCVSESGIIDAPIDRMEGDIKRVVTEFGKSARTGYSPLECFSNHSLLEVELFTGRTHQIRVHLSHINHPIVADHLYSHIKTSLIERQALHCSYMEIDKIGGGERLRLSCPLHNDMANAIDLLYALE